MGAGFGGKYHLKDKRTGKNMHCRPERGRQDNTAKKIAAELKEREDLRVDYMPQNYEDRWIFP